MNIYSFPLTPFETFVVLSTFLLPNKLPVLSAVFSIAFFKSVCIASVATLFALDLLTLQEGFWQYLFFQFLPIFLANDKDPQSFTYTLGSIE